MTAPSSCKQQQQLQATATVAGRAGQAVQACEQQDNTPTWVPDRLAERGLAVQGRSLSLQYNTAKLEETEVCYD
jgi:hypothetical protein